MITIRARRSEPAEDFGFPGEAEVDESIVEVPGWSILVGPGPAATAREETCCCLEGVEVVADVAPVSVSGEPEASSLMLPVGPCSLLFLGSTETYEVCILAK